MYKQYPEAGIQKKVNVTGLKLISLERPACKFGWGVWEPVLGRVPTIARSDKSTHFTLTVCTNNVVYAKYLLSFGNYEMLVCARQKLISSQ